MHRTEDEAGSIVAGMTDNGNGSNACKERLRQNNCNAHGNHNCGEERGHTSHIKKRLENTSQKQRIQTPE